MKSRSLHRAIWLPRENHRALGKFDRPSHLDRLDRGSPLFCAVTFCPPEKKNQKKTSPKQKISTRVNPGAGRSWALGRARRRSAGRPCGDSAMTERRSERDGASERAGGVRTGAESREQRASGTLSVSLRLASSSVAAQRVPLFFLYLLPESSECVCVSLCVRASRQGRAARVS